MRLRSILRRRRKLKGVLAERTMSFWPNAFFAEQGLFSLSVARLSTVNPVEGEPSTGEPDAGDRTSGSEGGGNFVLLPPIH